MSSVADPSLRRDVASGVRSAADPPRLSDWREAQINKLQAERDARGGAIARACGRLDFLLDDCGVDEPLLRDMREWLRAALVFRGPTVGR